jgi:hypothetical protein
LGLFISGEIENERNFILEVIWVKRPVYVFESKSVNPNYRFGPCNGWVEQGTFAPVYKRITDVNGKLWLGYYFARWVIQSDDGKYKDLDFGAQIIVNMRRDHGTAIVMGKREGGFKTYKKKDVNMNLFTRTGFVKFTR